MHEIQLVRGSWHFSDQEKLGSPGGFGEVFGGWGSNGTETRFAIKRLFEASSMVPRECDIASSLIDKTFAHLIPIYDVGRDGRDMRYYIVMAKATQSLETLLEKNPNGFSEPEAASLCRAIVGGLRELHGAEIVHRDLKPGNVLLHNGIWKLSDFGISRDLSKATSKNTLRACWSNEYAAPEQWQSLQVTKASDIYALGCILFALRTGEPPFMGPGPDDFRRQHLYKAPSELASSPLLGRITMGCLAKDPASRLTLDAVDNMLKQVQSSAVTDEPDLLSKIGVHLANEAAAQVAQIAHANDQKQQRETLAEDGTRILLEIRKALISSIQERAPTLQDDKHFGVYRLGGAYLRFDLKFRLIEPGSFSRSGWDVVAGALIVVKQSTNNYEGRSANLWYMRSKSQDQYRWWEVPYMFSPLMSGTPSRVEPFGWEQPGALQYADEAASSVMGQYQHAASPTTIDGEDVESFCAKWRNYFALAAINGLERPRSLPED
jgi:serine/threonine protein kinase